MSMRYNQFKLGKKEKRKQRASATALGYDPQTDEAPRVLAKGYEHIADKIIALAKENGIPIREDPILAAALATLEVNETIPPELYAVIAEVLVYVYRIQNKKLNLEQ